MRILALDAEPASVKAAAANLEGQAIDVLLNNAGVGGARVRLSGNIDYENSSVTMVANTPGRYRATSAFETKKAMATVRARQQVFRFQVLSRYGCKCAVCSISVYRQLLA